MDKTGIKIYVEGEARAIGHLTPSNGVLEMASSLKIYLEPTSKNKAKINK